MLPISLLWYIFLLWNLEMVFADQIWNLPQMDFSFSQQFSPEIQFFLEALTLKSVNTTITGKVF